MWLIVKEMVFVWIGDGHDGRDLDMPSNGGQRQCKKVCRRDFEWNSVNEHTELQSGKGWEKIVRSIEKLCLRNEK